MTTKERLMQELESAPDDLLEAVLDFILTTKEQSSQIRITQSELGSSQSEAPPNGMRSLLDLLDSMPLSPEELASLPHDGAENHDHYLYGAPKKSV
ncbi:MAG: hypothetical protein NW220_10070 [Leptolyngbyaceae cyanobacterium bins.349]|nr:hypothetical protein [Leptolyngbyaceae cyanobacterium bins.349]